MPSSTLLCEVYGGYEGAVELPLVMGSCDELVERLGDLA